MNGHGTPSALSAPLPPTRTTTTTTSCMNRFLSSMTLIALGAIGGFGIFHSALQYRIEQTELNHNATLAIVTSRFFESEKERNRCIETDDGRLQELSDLRGRLDAQHKSWYDLTAAQRSMVSKQKEHNAQMEQFRDVYERDQRALASLKAESDQKDRDLIAFHENLQKYRRTKVELESELTKLQKTKEGETLVLQVKMEHKDLKLGSLEENLNLLSNQKEQLERERHELQMRIQQQDEEFESLKKNSDTLQNQKRQLEHDVAVMRDTMSEMESKIVEKDNEVSEKERRIRQQDEELESFKKHSDTLQNQKRRLEHDVGVMRDKLDNMESQVVEKDKELSETDKELSEYREEEEELEKKIVNFREGMLGLLEEKIHEIQELENRVDLLKKEKVDLEMKLDNWREGMLDLVKEKMQEIDHLKAVLAESRTSMKAMMNEIEMARSEQVEAEEFVRERLVTIDRNSDSDTPEQKEMIQELLQEIELVRVALRESQEWLVEAKKEIEHRKSDQAESEELISEKMNEINDLKLQIERDEESANEKISELESDLAEAREAVKEKTNQIEHLKHLNSELQEIVMEINDLKSGASVEPNNILPGSTTSEMMIDHVQQRDGVMCRQLFGKGPYYVKFVIRLPPAEPNGSSGGDGDGDGEHNNTMFFVIELSSRKELPHSTYTFLTLVESNLYNDGVAFLSARDDGSLKIESSHSPDAIRLEQKLKSLGLTGGSSLSFVEPSTSGEALPCGEHTFGFVHRGPGLNLFLLSDNEDDNETDCFAQVIRGQEDLQKIKSILLESRELLEIISAKHLRVD